MDPWAVSASASSADSASEARSLLADANLPDAYHQIFKRTAEPHNGFVSYSLLQDFLLNSAQLPLSTAEKIISLIGGDSSNTNNKTGKVSKGEFCVALALAAFAQQKQQQQNETRENGASSHQENGTASSPPASYSDNNLTLALVSNNLGNLPVPTLNTTATVTPRPPSSLTSSIKNNNTTSSTTTTINDDPLLSPSRHQRTASSSSSLSPSSSPTSSSFSPPRHPPLLQSQPANNTTTTTNTAITQSTTSSLLSSPPNHQNDPWGNPNTASTSPPSALNNHQNNKNNTATIPTSTMATTRSIATNDLLAATNTASPFYHRYHPTSPLDEETDLWNNNSSSQRNNNYSSSSIVSSGGGITPVDESVRLTLEDGLEGKWLGRFQTYRLETEKRDTTVVRRYSDFVWLLECLTSRYPFRNLPSLPPKRASISAVHLTTDDGFLERRRRGLQRFINVIAKHPIFGVDNLVNTFLIEKTELSLWKKSSSINLSEEYLTRQLTAAEEMSIPTDLEEKLGHFKARIGRLVEHWSRVCLTLERIVRRREAEAVDYMRIRNGLNATVDLQRNGWRSTECDLTESNTERIADRLGANSDLLVRYANKFSLGTLEDIKMQRDSFINFRELFVRHTKLAPDSVDKLRKNIDTLKNKIESATQARREGWQADVDRLSEHVESNHRMIESLLKRRIFIRFAMWQELQTLFKFSTTLTPTYRKFVTDELAHLDTLRQDWGILFQSLETF